MKRILIGLILLSAPLIANEKYLVKSPQELEDILTIVIEYTVSEQVNIVMNTELSYNEKVDAITDLNNELNMSLIKYLKINKEFASKDVLLNMWEYTYNTNKTLQDIKPLLKASSSK